MSERWQYQFKSGGTWGVFMAVFTVLFDLKDKPFAEQLLQPIFYIRSAAYIVLGIFVFGYYLWKTKQKNSKK